MKDKIKADEEITLMKEKIRVFKKFGTFFKKFDKFDNDDELLKVCNYLLISIYILFNAQEKKRDYETFSKIILCCLPFEIENAKKVINDLKNSYFNFKIKIDDNDINQFDIDNLKSSSKIYFDIKEITVQVKDVNWNLDSDSIIELLKGDNFMFCFRFPKISEINYIYINEKIRINYKKLFKTIIQSEIMRSAMNIDEDAKKFKYPFTNDEILNEIEKNCYLVPFPAKNFYRISDRGSLIIYLNSFIDSSNFKTIFTDIDNITKSKCHEIKHIYRVYIHIYNPIIKMKTPEISIKGLNKNQLTKVKYELFKAKRNVMDFIYSKRCIPKSEIKNLDYGDILEYAINGNKQDVFFIKNSLFCLDESSWGLDSSKFIRKYFESCFESNFSFQKKKNCDFINSVIEYFKLGTKIDCINDANTTKRASRTNLNETLLDSICNNAFYKPREKHFTLY